MIVITSHRRRKRLLVVVILTVKKITKFRIQLYWKIRETQRNSILIMESPIIITIKLCKTEVQVNIASHNDEGLTPHPNPETILITQMELGIILYIFSYLEMAVLYRPKHSIIGLALIILDHEGILV